MKKTTWNGIKGIITALITPFGPDGDVDVKRVRRDTVYKYRLCGQRGSDRSAAPSRVHRRWTLVVGEHTDCRPAD